LCYAAKSDFFNVNSAGALAAFPYFELNGVAFIDEAADIVFMDEQVVSVLFLNKPKAFSRIKPFNSTFHVVTFHNRNPFGPGLFNENTVPLGNNTLFFKFVNTIYSSFLFVQLLWRS